MDPYIPLISSGVAGPLGILHLPRMWQKAMLEATGRLHPDYHSLCPGFDFMVLDALGIARDDFADYIAANLPTYPQCEAWVREQCGASLDPELVAKLNAEILGYHHQFSVRGPILAANGLPDNGTLHDAVSLNNLDDWLGFHRQITRQE